MKLIALSNEERRTLPNLGSGGASSVAHWLNQMAERLVVC
jgi:hypothetical protein